MSVPFLVGLELYSRRLFNRVFYRQYAGMNAEWPMGLAEAMFEEVIRPSISPGAPKLIEEDRRQYYRLVLVSGELDFALRPVVRYLGFDRLVANSLEFIDGVATGRVVPPLVAEQEKVGCIERVLKDLGAAASESKAYSDSSSDLPMLEAVGHPVAVNPDRRLGRLAVRRRRKNRRSCLSRSRRRLQMPRVSTSGDFATVALPLTKMAMHSSAAAAMN